MCMAMPEAERLEVGRVLRAYVELACEQQQVLPSVYVHLAW